MATHLFGPDVGHKQRVLVHAVRFGGRPYGSEDHHRYQRDQRPRVRDRLHDAAAAVAMTYGRARRARDRKIPPRRPVVRGRLRRSATKRAIPVTAAYWSAVRLVRDGDRANHVRTPAITYITSPPRADASRRQRNAGNYYIIIYSVFNDIIVMLYSRYNVIIMVL